MKRIKTRPSGKLLESRDVEAFLDYMFREIPRRPEKLTLSAAGKAAAYLLRLVALGKPCHGQRRFNESGAARVRQEALEIARMILVCGVQYSNVKPSSKKRALQYLNQHSGTYFTHPYMDAVRQFVEDFEIPGDAPHLELPYYVSRSQSIWVSRARYPKTRPKARDDLSERIYVAYHVLRGQRRVRERIARALEAARVPRGAKKQGGGWDNDEVSDRAKKFEIRFKRDLKIVGQPFLLHNRQQLLLHWIRGFNAMKMLQAEIEHLINRRPTN